jgi:hypothetical protein
VVSPGFDADGKRIRKKVSGKTKAEVKDKLRTLHSELDAGLRTAQWYTVEKGGRKPAHLATEHTAVAPCGSAPVAHAYAGSGS